MDSRTISIVVPTRGRPDSAKRLIDSIYGSARQPDRLEIVLGADDDDKAAIDLKKLENARRKVRVLIRPRFTTLGALIDDLFSQTTTDIAGAAPDDVFFGAKDWDDLTRGVIVDGKIGSPALGDAPRVYLPAPFFTRTTARWIRASQGFILPPYFPFWFGDVWIADIADLTNTRAPLNWRIDMPEGHSDVTGMRELGFWARFYQATWPIRARAAAMMLGVRDDVATFRRIGEQAVYLNQRMQPMLRKETQDYWEARAVSPNPRYNQAKAAAEKLLAELHAVFGSDTPPGG